uniref:Uncharacterized protein n=1 Tax=Rhizophora mucronata TaxID=61149 RepID=A0A2P2R323_RHIMU
MCCWFYSEKRIEVETTFGNIYCRF